MSAPATPTLTLARVESAMDEERAKWSDAGDRQILGIFTTLVINVLAHGPDNTETTVEPFGENKALGE